MHRHWHQFESLAWSMLEDVTESAAGVLAMKRGMFLLILATIGCKNYDGPCAAWQKPRADQPGLSIEDQQRRGRDKYAILEDDFRIGPSLEMDRGSPTGR